MFFTDSGAWVGGFKQEGNGKVLEWFSEEIRPRGAVARQAYGSQMLDSGKDGLSIAVSKWMSKKFPTFVMELFGKPENEPLFSQFGLGATRFESAG